MQNEHHVTGQRWSECSASHGLSESQLRLVANQMAQNPNEEEEENDLFACSQK